MQTCFTTWNKCRNGFCRFCVFPFATKNFYNSNLDNVGKMAFKFSGFAV